MSKKVVFYFSINMYKTKCTDLMLTGCFNYVTKLRVCAPTHLRRPDSIIMFVALVQMILTVNTSLRINTQK
jgi:hypothetical protein